MRQTWDAKTTQRKDAKSIWPRSPSSPVAMAGEFCLKKRPRGGFLSTPVLSHGKVITSLFSPTCIARAQRAPQRALPAAIFVPQHRPPAMRSGRSPTLACYRWNSLSFLRLAVAGLRLWLHHIAFQGRNWTLSISSCSIRTCLNQKDLKEHQGFKHGSNQSIHLVVFKYVQ